MKISCIPSTIAIYSFLVYGTNTFWISKLHVKFIFNDLILEYLLVQLLLSISFLWISCFSFGWLNLLLCSWCWTWKLSSSLTLTTLVACISYTKKHDIGIPFYQFYYKYLFFSIYLISPVYVFDRARQSTFLLSDIQSGADFVGPTFQNQVGIPVSHTERVGCHGVSFPERGLPSARSEPNKQWIRKTNKWILKLHIYHSDFLFT